MKTGRPRDENVLRELRRCSKCKNLTEHSRYLCRSRTSTDYYSWRCMPCHSKEVRERYRFLKEHPGESFHRSAKKEHQVDCCPKCWTARSVTGACLCD